MFKQLRVLTLGGVLLLTVAFSSGCVAVLAAGAGAGTMAWIKGELIENVDASQSVTFAAAKKGLKSLGLPVDSEDEGQTQSVVKSSYGDGKKVTVVVEAFTDKASRIKIRVGFLGDRARSESILTSIKRHL